MKLTELPEWVCWVAQDESGCWWGFEAEPNQGHNFWYENEVGRCIRLDNGDNNPDTNSNSNPDWRDTLKRVPDK